jgi:hypothetical protein
MAIELGFSLFWLGIAVYQTHQCSKCARFFGPALSGRMTQAPGHVAMSHQFMSVQKPPYAKQTKKPKAIKLSIYS